MKRIHQTLRSRCFYVDAWLMHVWSCFFWPDQILSYGQKKWQTLLCCFRGFDREAMTVLSRGTRSTTDEKCCVYASRIRQLGACLPREAMYCAVVTWFYFIVCIYHHMSEICLRFLKMNSYGTDLMCLNIIFWEVDGLLADRTWSLESSMAKEWMDWKETATNRERQHMKLCRL